MHLLLLSMKKVLKFNLTFAVANQGRSFFRLGNAGSVMPANTCSWLPPIAPKRAKIAPKGTRPFVREDSTYIPCQATGGVLSSLTISLSAGTRKPALGKVQVITPLGLAPLGTKASYVPIAPSGTPAVDHPLSARSAQTLKRTQPNYSFSFSSCWLV
jgi:hypothetical protein